MPDREHWQLDGSAPDLYERYLVPAITAIWAADLIDRAQPKPEESALDIACGTGVVTRLAAERIATGRVVGLDFNADAAVPGAGHAVAALNGVKAARRLRSRRLIRMCSYWACSCFLRTAIGPGEMHRVLTPAAVALTSYATRLHRSIRVVQSSSPPRTGRIGDKRSGTFSEANEVGI